MTVFGLLHYAAAPPVDTSNGWLLPLLGILLGGSLLGSAFQFYKYRKQAAREDDSLIAQATGEAVKAAREMLAEYREELQSARDRIEQLTGQLQAATDRIAKLEERLAKAGSDRERLTDELVSAVERRRAVETELDDLRRRMRGLETLVGQRRADDPDEPAE